MTPCTQSKLFLSNRKYRREKMLRKMSNMRAAKKRNRLAHPAVREPKLVPWHPLEIGVRDKLSGEVGWVDFKSLRDAMRRLNDVRKFYVPGNFRI